MAAWYLARGTGAASLVLLTLTLVLGIVNVRRWAPSGVQRFLLDDAHRTLALLVVALLTLHVGISVIDGYAPIALVDAVVPFVSAYHPFWLGLGALALDLMAALVVTSLLRARLGLRAWRAVHWVAYGCWPLALVHGLGIGTDAPGWLVWLAVACGAAVAAAVAARLAPRLTVAP
jgi:predicted ferric reductase